MAAGPNMPGVDPQTAALMADGNRRSSKLLLAMILASFCFAIASIPLYTMLCERIDPGGLTNGATDVYDPATPVDTSRTIRVRLTTNVNRQLPWSFSADEPFVTVHPGERRKVIFRAKNLDTTGEISGRAVYDLNPPQAGAYYKKIECFCFQEQPLSAGESIEMPLVFWIDPKIPADITEISLGYTFFNMDSTLKRTIERRERAGATP
jgi:cytochrome c oxidase assembly protein subunit 11